MPEKNEYILGALLDPLDAAQKTALAVAVEHGDFKGWAGSFGNADAKAEPDKSGPPLVCDLLKSKDIPRARWADELDFCTCNSAYCFPWRALQCLSCVRLQLPVVQLRSEWTE